MKIDAARSKVAIYTYTEGLLSRLAHDLELEARRPSGDIAGDTCTLRIPIREIRVVGAIKRGKVDPSVLSIADRDAIERQIVEDVFHGENEISVKGTRHGEKVRLEIVAPTGRADVVCGVVVTDGSRAKGDVELSLKALGIAPVKGPLGAFRIADRIKVSFEISGSAEG